MGNLIDIAVAAILAQAGWSQSQEFLLFSGLMAACMCVLAAMAVRYEYVEEKSEGLQMEAWEEEEGSGSRGSSQDLLSD